MDNNSAKGAQFGFGKSEANKEEQKTNNAISPVEEEVASKTKADNVSDETKNKPVVDEDTNRSYTDIKSVTIMLITNNSLYRKANDKVLPKRKDFIGSCVESSKVLSANKREVEMYFPNLVGRSPNDSDFIRRVKQYLNNFRIPVNELGKTIDVSFSYNKKSDYYVIKAKEERIEEEYQNADKRDIDKLRKALKIKINALNALETEKCVLGSPVNIEDYILYRHCLLYNDVAKDMALIDVDPSIRFYFKDDQKEANRLAKFRMEVNKAKVNFVSCLSDDVLFDAVYTQYCVMKDMPIISSLAENRLEKEIKLDKFSSEEPVKFNRIFVNKDIKLIANIELLIARGELIRPNYSQNITTQDGDLIGANMKEAVIWFKNPENTSVVNAYMNKLKNI